MAASDVLVSAVLEFTTSFPRDAEFPCGEGIEIPTAAEQALVEAIERSSPVSAGVAKQVRSQLSDQDGYSLVIFAARMAVLAARSNEKRWLAAGVTGLVIDETVDWRDVLRATSIVYNCAMRIGFDLRQALNEVSHAATSQRCETIFDGFFSRPEPMRKIDHMGLMVTGTGHTLNFRSK